MIKPDLFFFLLLVGFSFTAVSLAKRWVGCLRARREERIINGMRLRELVVNYHG